MGLLAASQTLATDQSALTADQAALVAAQQAVTTAQGNVTTDDSAVVAALTAGPNPTFTPPQADGSILFWELDSSQPAGFTVTQVFPAT